MFSYFREQLTRQVDETKLTTSVGLRLHIRPAGIVDEGALKPGLYRARLTQCIWGSALASHRPSIHASLRVYPDCDLPSANGYLGYALSTKSNYTEAHSGI